MPSATIADEPIRRRARCPVCGAAPAADVLPFCSRGCRDRDLLAWFGEDHRILGRPVGPEDDPG